MKDTISTVSSQKGIVQLNTFHIRITHNGKRVFSGLFGIRWASIIIGLNIVLLSLNLNAQVIPGVAASSKRVGIARPENYFYWDPVTVVEPSNYEDVNDGEFFWQNINNQGLRSSQHWTGLGYSIETRDGRDRFHFHVAPRDPDFSGDDHYNYRAEIQRQHASGHPPDTKEWLGFGYIVPDAGLKDRVHEFGICQWHTGTAPGGPYANNFPIFYIGLAYSGQTDNTGDPAVLNELVVVNKVRDFEVGPDNGRYNTGITFDAGERHEFIQYVKAGTGSLGTLKIWHREKPDAGTFGEWTLIYNANESTIWNEDDDGGSNSQVHGDWKLGIYAFGITTLAGVEDDEDENGGAPGSYDIDLDLTYIKDCLLLEGDPYYNADLFQLVNTSNVN